MDLGKIFTHKIEAQWLFEHNVMLDILRLDTIHNVVSGNKWFKLKYYLENAIALKAIAAGTFGGAYSNHIVAFSYACKMAGLKSIGIIRGEEPLVLSDSLLDAKNVGMEIHFVNREAYRDPGIIKQHFKNVYWINEGGYGVEGAKGAADILLSVADLEKYTHIVCAVGTGTMMAGLIKAAKNNQQVIGISSMKNNYALTEKVNALLTGDKKNKSFKIMHDYHFGGYAKHPAELLSFMNDVWQQHQLPTDIVYTSKTFYAIKQLISNNTIPSGSNVLMIHSGGLQGNRSLPGNTLLF